jgi:hypothetical protein
MRDSEIDFFNEVSPKFFDEIFYDFVEGVGEGFGVDDFSFSHSEDWLGLFGEDDVFVVVATKDYCFDGLVPDVKDGSDVVHLESDGVRDKKILIGEPALLLLGLIVLYECW